MKTAGGLGLNTAVRGSGQVWQLANQIVSWFSRVEDCHGWKSRGGGLLCQPGPPPRLEALGLLVHNRSGEKFRLWGFVLAVLRYTIDIQQGSPKLSFYLT